MIVFSNTTPIIALSSIQRLDLLPSVFGRIHLVSEVVDECGAGGTIAVPDLRQLDWIDIVESTPLVHPTALHTLDMAKKLQADWVVIDEKIGRNLAEYLGLHVTGTLGVLLKAKQQGSIPSFRDCVNAMRAQGLRYHPSLVDKLAEGIGEA